VKAVVVSHGEVDPADAAHVRGAELIVAADGGREHLARWGIAPHIVVGDLDSLGADALASLEPSRVERHPVAKDKTDTELAIERALSSGATEVVIVGALGGPRLDHAIANTLLLALDRGGAAELRLVRGPIQVRLLRGGRSMALRARDGELVSLIPVGGDAQGVRTEGLRYPLHGEPLRMGSSRGVSNEVSAPRASVSLASGTLLVVEGGALAPQPKP
jgi:thiamine pyrophosphokinase